MPKPDLAVRNAYICRLLVERRMTALEVGRIHNLSPQQVRTIARANGIKLTAHTDRIEQQRAQIVELHELGMPVEEIAVATGTTIVKVRTLLRFAGIRGADPAKPCACGREAVVQNPDPACARTRNIRLAPKNTAANTWRENERKPRGQGRGLLVH